ncbi:MAG: 30S ribosomal protein S13 [Planctomycetota bacterium]|nr:30S ribosomal protein S13 [Planctomycetota bacterium]
MPRIVGVDIPDNKVTWVALQYVHGIGKKSALALCASLGLDPTRRARELNDEELARLANEIESNFVVEGNLRRQTQQNVSRLKEIACYRGMRHRRGLPARGQRTQTNARTRKGPKRTVAGKKSVKALR